MRAAILVFFISLVSAIAGTFLTRVSESYGLDSQKVLIVGWIAIATAVTSLVWKLRRRR